MGRSWPNEKVRGWCILRATEQRWETECVVSCECPLVHFFVLSVRDDRVSLNYLGAYARKDVQKPPLLAGLKKQLLVWLLAGK